METIIYPYKPKNRLLALPTLILTMLVAFLAYKTITNDRGVSLYGFHFGVTGATLLFGIITALFAPAAIQALAALYKGAFSTQRVTLSSTAFTAPRSGNGWATETIELSKVRLLELLQVKKVKLDVISLRIYHIDGDLVIQESWLPDREAFVTLCNTLEERCLEADTIS